MKKNKNNIQNSLPYEKLAKEFYKLKIEIKNQNFEILLFQNYLNVLNEVRLECLEWASLNDLE